MDDANLGDKIKNLRGVRFGMLVVVDYSHTNRARNAVWNCVCDCAGDKKVSAKLLAMGSVKSCGCLLQNIESMKINAAKRYYKSRYANGDLTFEDFYRLSQINCKYCDDPPNNKFGRYQAQRAHENSKSPVPYKVDDVLFVYNGLDRIDPSKPHDLNNVVPCCKKCNTAKLNHSTEDFLSHIEKIYQHSIANKCLV